MDLREATKLLIQRVKRPGDKPRKLVVLRDGQPLTVQVRPGLLHIGFDARLVPAGGLAQP